MAALERTVLAAIAADDALGAAAALAAAPSVPAAAAAVAAAVAAAAASPAAALSATAAAFAAVVTAPSAPATLRAAVQAGIAALVAAVPAAAVSATAAALAAAAAVPALDAAALPGFAAAELLPLCLRLPPQPLLFQLLTRALQQVLQAQAHGVSASQPSRDRAAVHAHTLLAAAQLRPPGVGETVSGALAASSVAKAVVAALPTRLAAAARAAATGPAAGAFAWLDTLLATLIVADYTAHMHTYTDSMRNTDVTRSVLWEACAVALRVQEGCCSCRGGHSLTNTRPAAIAPPPWASASASACSAAVDAPRGPHCTSACTVAAQYVTALLTVIALPGSGLHSHRFLRRVAQQLLALAAAPARSRVGCTDEGGTCGSCECETCHVRTVLRQSLRTLALPAGDAVVVPAAAPSATAVVASAAAAHAAFAPAALPLVAAVCSGCGATARAAFHAGGAGRTRVCRLSQQRVPFLPVETPASASASASGSASAAAVSGCLLHTLLPLLRPELLAMRVKPTRAAAVGAQHESAQRRRRRASSSSVEGGAMLVHGGAGASADAAACTAARHDAVATVAPVLADFLHEGPLAAATCAAVCKDWRACFTAVPQWRRWFESSWRVAARGGGGGGLAALTCHCADACHVTGNPASCVPTRESAHASTSTITNTNTRKSWHRMLSERAAAQAHAVRLSRRAAQRRAQAVAAGRGSAAVTRVPRYYPRIALVPANSRSDDGGPPARLPVWYARVCAVCDCAVVSASAADAKAHARTHRAAY
jgi:hypothetical protein